MSEYIYRVDSIKNLEQVCNDSFRASRWTKEMYPHQVLKDIKSRQNEEDGLYFICFFTTQPLAENSLKNDFFYLDEEAKISRCCKEKVLRAGFTESWDDGFDQGKAYLFWCEEPLSKNNNKFSEKNISTNQFETLSEGKWIPLSQLFQ